MYEHGILRLEAACLQSDQQRYKLVIKRLIKRYFTNGGFITSADVVLLLLVRYDRRRLLPSHSSAAIMNMTAASRGRRNRFNNKSSCDCITKHTRPATAGQEGEKRRKQANNGKLSLEFYASMVTESSLYYMYDERTMMIPFFFPTAGFSSWKC